jgi:ribosomal protection tetracycline resistance protein
LLHQTLNLGILAHVDAGKTTLTERLLFEAGAIRDLGSVDQGSTQTDTLLLERQRGITIKSAVASFTVGDLAVSLLDTPGHPDFIAEVDRVLGVLDGAILVISAVEGVQSHTRILFRALQRLVVPTLFFVNKIDRHGADPDAVVGDIAQRLTSSIPLMGSVIDAGTRGADVRGWGAESPAGLTAIAELLADHDESVLTALIDDDREMSPGWLRATLAAQTAAGLVHPVFFGSAITGSGVDDLAGGIAELLPIASTDDRGPVIGSIFKIERGAHNEKVAFVRLRSGTIRVRDEVFVSSGHSDRVTSIRVFSPGGPERRPSMSAGEIGIVFGLRSARIGDVIGETAPPVAQSSHFAPPSLESIVVASREEDRIRLGTVLAQMAEQDPLINVHLDPSTQEISVSLYGEVQKEVIESTLATDFDIEVEFSETSTIFVERPLASGAAVEFLGVAPNPFLATVGLRIEPADAGTGVDVRIDPAILGLMPMAYFRAVEETTRETMRQGLCGWSVIDCTVTLSHAGFLGKHGLGHQYFNKSMSSTGEDFRKLTPLVTMDALRLASTEVHEPIHWLRLEVPSESLDPVLAFLKSLRGVTKERGMKGAVSTLLGSIPAASVHGLQRRLPDLTRGEGVAETGFDHYQPVSGNPPSRARLGPNPLDRVEYLKLLKVRTA